MKKFLFGVVFAVITGYSLFAQDVKFGIKGGLNLPNISASGTTTPVSEGYKSRLAVGAGIFTEFQLNSLFSVRLGVEYSGQGGQKNGMQAMPSQRLVTAMGSSMGMSMTEEQMAELLIISGSLPQFYYADIDNTTKFDYVMIPLLAQFGWDLGDSPWRLYVNAGPFVSFLVSGKQVSEGSSLLYSDASGISTLWDVLPQISKDIIRKDFPAMEETFSNPVTFGETNITGELKSTNFGITGNVGIRYQCGHNFFFVEAGGNYGFIMIQENSRNGSNRLGTGSVMLGYAFSLF